MVLLQLILSNKLLNHKEQIIVQMKTETAFSWLIKRIMVIHLKILPTNTSDTVIECLDVFTDNIQVLSYLINKGKNFYLFSLFIQVLKINILLKVTANK